MLRRAILTTLVAACVGLNPVPAADNSAEKAALKADVEATIAKAQAWLIEQQQPNGAFVKGGAFVVGFTGLAANALVAQPQGLAANDPRILKALTLLTSYQQPNGGIYDPMEGLGDYGTSLTLMLWTATKTGDAAAITKAQTYLLGIQNTDPKDPAHGGIGYGDDKPGDENLETTTFAVRALRESGVPASDPHLQEALKFIERCQNLSSVNKEKWAGNDGGAVYSPKESKALGSDASPADVEDAAQKAESGKLLSYGGMSYALISSYLALDLKPDDERVKAALAWCKDNYRFDANPGMRPQAARQGLFYYYAMMGHSMDLLKTGEFATKDGKQVDWRADLFAAIKSQALPAKVGDDPKGGLIWVNSAKRWGEGIPNVATTHMIIALKHIAASL